MASLGEVLDKLQDVVTALQTLHTDEDDLKAASAKIDQTLNNRLSSIQQVLNDGFSNLSQGIEAILLQQVFANKALAEIIAEEKTMICQLEQIAHHTCDILSESHIQTGLQTSLDRETRRILQIGKSVHPAAEIELQRLDDLRTQIEKCCPEEPPPPICIHQPCPAPPDFTDQPPPVDYKLFEPGDNPPPPPR
jgi:hypothetical protein